MLLTSTVQDVEKKKIDTLKKMSGVLLTKFHATIALFQELSITHLFSIVVSDGDFLQTCLADR